MRKIIYPYIPNSVPEIKQEMMKEIGIDRIDELYATIPEHLRIKGALNLPKPITSEYELKKHVVELLNMNKSCNEYINFLGAGCYDHYIPAVCDEINSRSEFLTAYCGDTYSDHGKCQAIFEYTSLIGELLEMDVVGLATYDGGQAMNTSIRMTSRITGRREVLIPQFIGKDMLLQLKQYNDFMDIKEIKINGDTGDIDLDDLRDKISDKTACVFVQNPSYFGNILSNCESIANIAHNSGAKFVVYVEPSSLGVLETPAVYGADIICGELQSLGIHMGYGSGLGGIIASRDEDEYIMNFPNHFYSLYENTKGERGFTRSLNVRTSYHSREEGIEFLGTNVGLWAITSAVYMSLLGPEGFYDLGSNILFMTSYAKDQISKIAGIKTLFPHSKNFQEFIVNFDDTGKTVDFINNKLLDFKIFGGYDLSSDYEELGQSAIYCITEKTQKQDIDLLTSKLKVIIETPNEKEDL
jgi:glycine dehydrogenase subunit 1